MNANETPLNDDEPASSPITEEANRTFFVTEGNLEAVNKNIARLAKRATKLGVQAPSIVITGDHMEWSFLCRGELGETLFVWRKYAEPARESDGKPTGRCRKVLHIELAGVETVCLAGWTFLATLDHELGEDSTIVRVVPGQELPVSYRHAGNLCEHCKRRTFRKATYVVRHEDGRTCQVGSTCLRDFLGIDASKAISAVDIYAMMREALSVSDGDEGGFGGSGSYSLDLVTYLSWVAKSVREDGWVSKTEAYDSMGTKVATAHIADYTMTRYYKQKQS